MLPVAAARNGLDEPVSLHLVLTGPGGGTWDLALGQPVAGDGAAAPANVAIVADAVGFCRLVANRAAVASLDLHAERCARLHVGRGARDDQPARGDVEPVAHAVAETGRARRQRVAVAVALEQADADLLLQRVEPAKDSRVHDTERPRRGLNLLYRYRRIGVADTGHDRQPTDIGNKFAQKFDSFAGKTGDRE